MDLNDKKNISGAQFTQPPEEFQVRSATSGVSYDFEDVQPLSGGRYMGVDDALQCSLWTDTGNTLTINVRMLGLDGLIHPFQFQVAGANIRTENRSRFQLMEGWILSVACTWNGGGTSNQYGYAQVALTRAPFGTGQIYCVLCAGYANNFQALSYPESPITRPTDGPGVIRSINQAAPAAGADLVVTVPVGARWRVVSLRATLTTAVAVANRDVSVTYDDGANIYMESPSNLVLAASSANVYNYFDSATLLGTAFNGRTVAPLPSLAYLVPGHRISTATTGIQAADQWSAMQLQIVEWQDNG